MRHENNCQFRERQMADVLYSSFLISDLGFFMSRLTQATEQIIFARQYTLRLLETIPPEEWFRQLPGGVSHIGWQVGHLAMAEYRLALERTRGRRPEDAHLISDDFLALFSRDSVPDPDASKYPSSHEIRTVLDRVHEKTLQDIRQLSEEELDRPVLKPHAFVKTRLWALIWCSHHEMIHAGQLGLLRRQLGQPPLW